MLPPNVRILSIQGVFQHLLLDGEASVVVVDGVHVVGNSGKRFSGESKRQAREETLGVGMLAVRRCCGHRRTRRACPDT